MAWVKLDDGFHSHPTTWAVGLESNGLYCRSLSYAGFHLTDGFVPEPWLYAQVPGSRGSKDPKGVVQRLLDHGLFERVEGGFQIVGYLDFNPPRERVLNKRAQAAERMANGRRTNV